MDNGYANFEVKLSTLIEQIYPDENTGQLIDRIVQTFWPMGLEQMVPERLPGNSLWSEDDILVITYGNSVVDGTYKPLDLLHDFLKRYLTDMVSGVHILPFFPYTSDDGFAVTDYCAVNGLLGDWEDINRIAGEFKLMSDLVLNHVSSQSNWFNDYLQGHEPYDRFFYEALPSDDLSEVVRPRTSPLLRKVETKNGPRHVWCTFSHDQVDLNFKNPDVLVEFLRIMRLHIDNGVRILRLDAVAFLWKEIGTNCVHLPETHAVVRLMRLLLDYTDEEVVLLTETNVPNAENLSYFGNRNEAHAIYNFSLPPLILHALLTGTSQHLIRWQMAMPPAQLGCAYLNFTASHDGIGMRPAEGLLSEAEIDSVIGAVKSFGGLVSMRSLPDGTERPYELNITFFEAMKGTVEGVDAFQMERFLCSQTIMMALEGIPAFYIHSLVATPNDYEGVEKSNHNRAINRHRWDYPELREKLDDASSMQARVYAALKGRMAIRRKQPAFHPNATQFTMQLGDKIFAFWRQSMNRDQSIFALHNVSREEVLVSAVSINLIGGENWYDLLTGEKIAADSGDIVFAPYQCRWITNRN
ncbi:sugar phosphorylase [Kordiimonas pumila]|uniref:Sugar phosphorylase n=1 Tax=Kordiimonas pumila TaxID=2161677 RepID=A0ABV7D7R7_9PROT|nr:sugar phosphorylase [Kordiimonas pumila]